VITCGAVKFFLAFAEFESLHVLTCWVGCFLFFRATLAPLTQ